MEPLQGIAFVSVTGKPVFSLTGEAPDGNANSASEFLANGGQDTGLLVRNKIDVVYASPKMENIELNGIRKNMYILRTKS